MSSVKGGDGTGEEAGGGCAIAGLSLTIRFIFTANDVSMGWKRNDD
jgi:hypothetical protein